MIEVGVNRDKALAALSDFSARLYFMVLPHTDNFGRYEGDSELIRAVCMPLSKRPIPKFENAILEICESQLWTRYETENGKLVIQFNEESFDRINKFLVKNREMPEYPPYREGMKIIGRPLTEKTDAKNPAQKVVEEKKLYGKSVTLTDSEHKRLVDEFGIVFVNDCIEFFNLYIEEKPAYLDKISSCNAAIRRWVVDAVKEKQEKRNGGGWKYGAIKSTNFKLEECQYCHGKFPHLTSHELNCPKAPPPAPKEKVDEFMDQFHALIDKRNVK